jgi:hypothetical protein
VGASRGADARDLERYLDARDHPYLGRQQFLEVHKYPEGALLNIKRSFYGALT